MLFFFIIVFRFALLIVALLICLIILTSNKQKPKTAPIPEPKTQSLDSHLENVACMLDYLTAKGFSPETATRIINLVLKADDKKEFTVDKQRKFNLLMNRLLQYSIKQG